jgi:hypothetical protein
MRLAAAWPDNHSVIPRNMAKRPARRAARAAEALSWLCGNAIRPAGIDSGRGRWPSSSILLYGGRKREFSGKGCVATRCRRRSGSVSGRCDGMGPRADFEDADQRARRDDSGAEHRRSERVRTAAAQQELRGAHSAHVAQVHREHPAHRPSFDTLKWPVPVLAIGSGGAVIGGALLADPCVPQSPGASSCAINGGTNQKLSAPRYRASFPPIWHVAAPDAPERCIT